MEQNKIDSDSLFVCGVCNGKTFHSNSTLLRHCRGKKHARVRAYLLSRIPDPTSGASNTNKFKSTQIDTLDSQLEVLDEELNKHKHLKINAGSVVLDVSGPYNKRLAHWVTTSAGGFSRLTAVNRLTDNFSLVG